MTELVPLPDGSELRLTVAEPDSSVRGGIVVVHEARGVTDAVREFAADSVLADTDATLQWLADREVTGDRMGSSASASAAASR